MRSILIHLVMVLSNSSSGGLTGFMCLVQKSIAEIVGSYSKWVFSFQEAIVLLLFWLLGLLDLRLPAHMLMPYAKFVKMFSKF